MPSVYDNLVETNAKIYATTLGAGLLFGPLFGFGLRTYFYISCVCFGAAIVFLAAINLIISFAVPRTVLVDFSQFGDPD